MRTLPLLVLPLAACASPLSEEDSRAAFGALNTISRDVQEQAYATFEAAAKEIDITEQDGTYTFEGQVEGDGSADWTGLVTVDGTAAFVSPDSAFDVWAFDFRLGYVGAECDGLVLDGGLELLMEYGYESGDGSFHYQYTMYGVMDATGEAEGTISFDYTLTVSVDTEAETATYEATGDINGYDVSGWATEGSGTVSYGDYGDYYDYNG